MDKYGYHRYLVFLLNAQVQQNVNVAGHTRIFSLPAGRAAWEKNRTPRKSPLRPRRSQRHSPAPPFCDTSPASANKHNPSATPFDNTTPSPRTGTSDTLQQPHLGQAFWKPKCPSFIDPRSMGRAYWPASTSVACHDASGHRLFCSRLNFGYKTRPGTFVGFQPGGGWKKITSSSWSACTTGSSRFLTV